MPLHIHATAQSLAVTPAILTHSALTPAILTPAVLTPSSLTPAILTPAVLNFRLIQLLASGQLVFNKAFETLDIVAPLENGLKYGDADQMQLDDAGAFCVKLSSGKVAYLADKTKHVGSTSGADGKLTGVMLLNNQLHAEIQIDPSSAIGSTHRTGVKHVLMEAAMSAICDCEVTSSNSHTLTPSRSHRVYHTLTMRYHTAARVLKA